jgi:hypothetical protein
VHGQNANHSTISYTPSNQIYKLTKAPLPGLALPYPSNLYFFRANQVSYL